MVVQNFKLAVRALEHTTLLLTALSFACHPDLLVSWITHGYTPFDDDRHAELQVAVLGHSNSGRAITAADTCCSDAHLRVNVERDVVIQKHVVRVCVSGAHCGRASQRL